MTIAATIKNAYQQHEATVSTNGNGRQVTIPGKPEGYGSAVNGGELLFLALATCFCNDVYREAARRNMAISLVEVTVTGEFGQEGEPASNITYQANIQAPNHSQQEIASLIRHVDQVAEVHNTLRKGVDVTLKV
ncbi:OsmC family protein [Pontibacter mangrovi]|uniref:OsmC family protein n=1 Tax=Pontibacter mangrovi TaxID=2589816 RepID=A0A501W8V4_9BACT|nr:OsmC family protein [Pontibacter mangrovi]TPE43711.1 OsmC family protein [Pontibacter mangrovi]